MVVTQAVIDGGRRGVVVGVLVVRVERVKDVGFVFTFIQGAEDTGDHGVRVLQNVAFVQNEVDATAHPRCGVGCRATPQQHWAGAFFTLHHQGVTGFRAINRNLNIATDLVGNDQVTSVVHFRQEARQRRPTVTVDLFCHVFQAG